MNALPPFVPSTTTSTVSRESDGYLREPASANVTPTKADAPSSRADLLRSTALRAAVKLLTEEGWDAVTQARVAAASGLGRATIYRRWPDRRKLVEDAVLAANLAVRHRKAHSGDLRSDLIVELRNIRGELSEGPLAAVLAALIDRAEWEGDLLEIKRTVSRHSARVIHALLSEGIERGQLRAVPSASESVAILMGPLLYRRLVSAERLSGDFLDGVLDSYLAAAGADRPSDR
jgi:AcrR family transcriptional regulator